MRQYTTTVTTQILSFLNEAKDLNELLARNHAGKPVFEKTTILKILERRKQADGVFKDLAWVAELNEREQAQFERLAYSFSEYPWETVTYTLVGSLRAEKGGRALPGLTVEAMLGDSVRDVPRELNKAVTNGQGRYVLSYQLVKGVEYDSLPLKITVRQRQHLVLEFSLEVAPGSDRVYETSIPNDKLDARSPVPIQALQPFVQLPESLAAYLNREGISDLKQLAQRGGLAALKTRPEGVPEEVVRQIDAHAQLALFSDDPGLNARLIEKGYTSVGAIARTDQDTFVAATQGILGEQEATTLHLRTTATFLTLNNLITQGSIQGPTKDEFTGNLLTTIDEAPCVCEDCEAAVSPLAYLADLLDYTVAYVQDNNFAITLKYLEEHFFQPFESMPADCSAQEDVLCQKRIACEVLRAYVQTLSSSGYNTALLESKEREYLVAAYETLLVQLGTSYAEVRAARHAASDVRQRLADRIGIDLDPAGARPDHLDELFMNYDPMPNTAFEGTLEIKFGYRNTRKPPLTPTLTGQVEQRRKARLRRLWREEDWLKDAYSEKELPVIDPDLIGPDDLRNPVNGQSVYDLWEQRRQWIDQYIIASFESKTAKRGVYLNVPLLVIPGVDLTKEQLFGRIEIIKVNLLGGAIVVDQQQVSHLEYQGTETWLGLRQAPSVVGQYISAVQFLKIRTVLKVPDTNTGIDELVISDEDLTNDFNGVAVSLFDAAATVLTTWAAGSYSVRKDNNKTILTPNVPNNIPPGTIQIRYDKQHNVAAVVEPSIELMLNSMRTNFSYQSTSKQPWPNTATNNNLSAIRDDLAQGQDVETNTNIIRDDYKLETDAFLRLAELYDKNRLSFLHPSNPVLTEEENQEVYSILTQAVKNAFQSDWIAEEQTQNIKFDNYQFWMALKEPTEGYTPVVMPTGIPFIDPELVALKDLPENLGGVIARTRWNQRQTQLHTLTDNIENAYRNNGFDAMLEFGLNNGNSYSPTTPQYIDGLIADLESADQSVIDAAKAEIDAQLHISFDDFLFIKELRAQALGLMQQPSPEDMLKAYRIISTAHKRAFLYATWRTEEDGDGLTAKYWFAIKHRLPRWRADAGRRAAWQEALRRRKMTPIIDPDIVRPIDLLAPTSGPAYTQWNARRLWVDGLMTTLGAFTRDFTGIDNMIAQALGIGANEILALNDLQHTGESIAGRLDQLNLNYQSLQFLVSIITVSQNDPASILDSEWQEVFEILAQAQKLYAYSAWHTDEKMAAITLSQDFFKPREKDLSIFPIDEESSNSRWLYNRQKRRQWERKLGSRIEQEETVAAGIQQVVDETGDQCLHLLRDGIIQALAKTGESLADAGKRLGDQLIIDLKEGCCRKITRLGQAIESLQLLLWQLRLSLMKDSHPNLNLIRDQYTFDEEWKWIGSYATWRAAMFVFMYPENLLYPTLRREQTPGFQKLVKRLRDNKRLTPKEACSAAKEYSEYLRDMANLLVEATVDTQILVHKEGCQPHEKDYQATVFFKFARSPISNKIYWSATKPDNYNEDTFWEEVPDVEGEVTQIFGAAVYRYYKGDYIYLFYKRVKEDKRLLTFIRYDLNKLVWDTPIDLEIPEKDRDFQAVVMQRFTEKNPPHITIQYDQFKCYFQSMDKSGEDWAADDWEMHIMDWILVQSTVHVSATAYNSDGTFEGEHWAMITQGVGGDTKIYYRIFGPNDDGAWYDITIPTGGHARNFVGAWCGGWFNNRVIVFYKNPVFSSLVLSHIVITSGGIPGVINYNLGLLAHYQELTLRLNENTRITFDTALDDPMDFQALAIIDKRNLADLIEYIITNPAVLVTNVNYILKEFSLSGGGLATFTQITLKNHLKARLYHVVYRKIERDEVWAYADKYMQKFSSVGGLAGLFFAILEGATVTLSNREDTFSYDYVSSQHEIAKIAPKSGFVTSHGSIGNFYQYQSFAYQIKDRLIPIPSGSSQEEKIRNARGWTVLNTVAPFGILNEARINPVVYAGFDITNGFSASSLQQRADLILSLYENNRTNRNNLEYIKEAYYFVPMYCALVLQQRGHYREALDWYRTVYDYSQDPTTRVLLPQTPDPADTRQVRKIYYGLTLEEGNNTSYNRDFTSWLLDPLNPHAIAETRNNAYTHYTLLSLIRCFLAYADAEYTLDTSESVPRAKALYDTALELLEQLKPQDSPCSGIIGDISIQVGDDYWDEVLGSLVGDLADVHDIVVVQEAAASAMRIAGTPGLAPDVKVREIEAVVREAQAKAGQTMTIAQKMAKGKARTEQAYLQLMSSETYQPVFSNLATTSVVVPSKVQSFQLPAEISSGSGASARDGVTPPFGEFEIEPYDSGLTYTELEWVPAPIFNFCIPPNPVIEALCLKAELSLFKIRNCMNIAGVVRELEIYAAPTDTTSGLPVIGGDGQLSLPGTIRFTPTQYRYQVLIERAKQLVGIAQQVESAFLSALEKRDAEYYNLMKARQDLSLSKAGIRLQTLRVKEAESGVDLAEIQRERAQIQVNELQEMIDAGLLNQEILMIASYVLAGAMQIGAIISNAVFEASRLATQAASVLPPLLPVTSASAAPGFGALVTRSVFESLATGANTTAQVASIYASHERRKQQWEYEKALATQDIKIGDQQIKLAEDHVRVVNQEKVISEMQSEFAQDTVDFLSNKFTNVELYEWMSDVLEGVYATFLQYATATAQMAANQLAFERQEVPPPFIQSDYWETPTDSAIIGNEGNGVDRRGLTGSARLLQDIYRLDQYAFEKNQRKLQLTKTISLAGLAPIEFQRFKSTGVLTFSMPMEQFDRDFPGHYLRLIKKVKTSVIALIPPVAGIKATLTSTGISRVTVGGDIFQTVPLRRPTETIALTSPREATGLFELQPENEFLNPFEGLGVDAFWEFRMEKAANYFDYSTIADVLITLEYTALNSFDYRRQVIKNLDTFVSADRPFSLKYEFADQWYDLHHPEQAAVPMQIGFSTRRNDFPPNISSLQIKHVAVYCLLQEGTNTELDITLQYRVQGSTGQTGGAAKTIDGLASTRSGSASAWVAIAGKAVEGDWTFSLPNDAATKNLFLEDRVEDIILVVTFEGEGAAYLT